MKKLWLIVLAVLMAGVVIAADNTWQTQYALGVFPDTATVTADHDSVGSWSRVCSTGVYTPLDSGLIVTMVTGWVTLGPGDRLYVGLDSADGTGTTCTDTLYDKIIVQPPTNARGEITMPFQAVYAISGDSGDAVLGRTVSLATQGGHTVQVNNLLLQVYMLAASANGVTP